MNIQDGYMHKIMKYGLTCCFFVIDGVVVVFLPVCRSSLSPLYETQEEEGSEESSGRSSKADTLIFYMLFNFRCFYSV